MYIGRLLSKCDTYYLADFNGKTAHYFYRDYTTGPYCDPVKRKKRVFRPHLSTCRHTHGVTG